MSDTITIRDKNLQVLYNERQIAEAVKGIAERINSEMDGKYPVFVAVLNGAFIFAADLLKQVTIPCEITFVKLRSYQGTKSSGQVKSIAGLDMPVEGRNVVIVEDIVDTGLTLQSLATQLQENRAGSLKVATLLFKPGSFRGTIKPDYTGFEVEDRFVVGYGMDYCGEGRNLKEVYVLA